MAHRPKAKVVNFWGFLESSYLYTRMNTWEKSLVMPTWSMGWVQPLVVLGQLPLWFAFRNKYFICPQDSAVSSPVLLFIKSRLSSDYLQFQRCLCPKPEGLLGDRLTGGGISQPSNSKVFSFGAQKVKHLLATHCKHVSVFNMLTVLCSPAHVFRKETGYDV